MVYSISFFVFRGEKALGLFWFKIRFATGLPSRGEGTVLVVVGAGKLL